MVYNIQQRTEPSVVIEAALGMRPKTIQRGRAVPLVGGTVGLEAVDANFGWSVHIPSGLCVQRRNMAGRTFAAAVKYSLTRLAAASSKLPLGGIGAKIPS